MATSITGIAPLFDFTNENKFVIFTPYKGAGVNGNLHLIANTTGQGAWDRVDIFQDSTYDFNINAYVVTVLEFSPSFRVFGTDVNPETGSGTFEAYFGSETPYKVDFVYDSKSYQTNYPQGMAITTSPCIGNKTKVFAYTEPKGPDHYSQSAVSQQILIDTTNNVTYLNPLVAESQPIPVYGAIFDLGLQNANATIDYRIIGLAGVAGNDYIDLSLTTTCSTSCVPTIASGGTLPNATSGVLYNHNIEITGDAPLSISNIVKPSWATITLTGTTINITGTPTTSDTNVVFSFNMTSSCETVPFTDNIDVLAGCTAPTITTHPSSITACNTPSGTFSVTAAGTAPLSYQWKLNGSDIIGQINSSLNATANGSYTVVVTNSCGSVTSNAATLVTNLSPSGGGVQTPINISVGTPYSKTITYTGITPLNISNIIKPSWLSIVLVGNVVTISGTPTIGDIGSADYSFDIVNVCGSQSTSTTGGTVITNCVNVGGGSIAGNLNPVFNVNETYILSGLTGTAPFNITTVVTGGSIVSGQGTNTVVVKWTANGTITFNVTNCGGSGSTTVFENIIVITANTENDSFSIDVNNTLTNLVTNNDTVCSSGVTTYELNTNVSNGTLTFNSNGTFEYIPLLNYTGTDSFTYNIKCNGIILDTSTVNITINPYTANAVNDNYSTGFGIPYNGTVVTNDTPCNTGNTYYKLINGTVTNGSVIFNSNGTFTFTPNSLLTGSFRYEILCGISLATAVVLDTATVTITITCTPVTNFDIVGDIVTFDNHQETFTLENINGTPPHTIQWIVGGGNIINGQGTTTLNVVFTQKQNTFVKAIVTNCGNAIVEKTKFVSISLPPCCDCC